MDLFSTDDYKAWINEWVAQQPGRGHYKKMAEHLNVSTVLISQIFKGAKDLSPEQAWDLCDFLNLTNLQKEYFFALVQRDRAGTHRLKAHWDEKLRIIQKQSNDLSQRLPKDQRLTSEQEAEFYSNWYYSAIRLLTSIEGFEDVQSIAHRLSLPSSVVSKATDFLLETRLCVLKDGKLRMGPQRTHLSKDSHLTRSRNSDWRTQAITRMPERKSDEIFFSAPLSIHHDEIAEVQKEILEFIDKLSQRVQKTEPTELACINIDWFRV